MAMAAVCQPSMASNPSKMSLEARQAIDNIYYQAAKGDARVMAEADNNPVGIIFRLQPGESAQDLNIPGLRIVTTVENIVVAAIPLTQLDNLADIDAVSSIELSQMSEPDMLFVRMGAMTGVSKVHTNPLGELNQPYLGEGVVVGLLDTGLDPNHINFRTGANYEDTRVKGIYTFYGSTGIPNDALTTPDEIKAFTTEYENKNHGTHVLGIMAGGYSGPGYWHDYDFGTPDSLKTEEQNNRTDFKDLNPNNTKPMPYYGIAPKAEIIIGCGDLYSNSQIVTAQKVIEYAESVGKPCVVNYSMGSQMGPKDGTGAFAEAMTKLGEKAIISWSSSNDGDKKAYLSEILGAKPSFKTTILPKKDNGATGAFEFWANDDKALKVRLFVYDPEEYDEYDIAVFNGATEGTTFLTAEKISEQSLNNIFNGTISVNSQVIGQNNRFQVYIKLSDDYRMNNLPAGNLPRLAVEITGYTGQRVDANANSTLLEFSNCNDTDFVNGSNIMCINNSATIKGNFAIGSYVPRDCQIQINTTTGKERARYYAGWEMPLDIAESSGFATLADGRKLPHTCAPGTDVVSSNNRYISNPTSEANAYTEFGGQKYYWRMMSGTSMSCPAFSGIAALWLEADPTLSYSDINKVLKKTCKKDKWVEARPERWGAGKVDAYEGMKYVLANKTSGIPSNLIEENKIMVSRIGNNRFEVTVGMEQTFTVDVTALSGLTVAKAQGVNTVAIDVSGLAKGIYILTAHNDNMRHSTKIVVR